MSNSYDFNITKGCSFSVTLNAQNSDGSYINLSGYSARGYVKNFYNSTGVILNLNPTPVAPFESGQILVAGTAQSTASLFEGSFLYDIEIYSSTYGLKILNGNFNIFPSTSEPVTFIPAAP